MTEAKHPSQQVESAEPPDRTASYTWRAVSGHNNLIITNTNQSPSSQPVWLQSTVELQGRTGLPLNTNKTTRQFSFWSISPPYLIEWLTDIVDIGSIELVIGVSPTCVFIILQTGHFLLGKIKAALTAVKTRSDQAQFHRGTCANREGEL